VDFASLPAKRHSDFAMSQLAAFVKTPAWVFDAAGIHFFVSFLGPFDVR